MKIVRTAAILNFGTIRGGGLFWNDIFTLFFNIHNTVVKSFVVGSTHKWSLKTLFVYLSFLTPYLKCTSSRTWKKVCKHFFKMISINRIKKEGHTTGGWDSTIEKLKNIDIATWPFAIARDREPKTRKTSIIYLERSSDGRTFIL